MYLFIRGLTSGDTKLLSSEIELNEFAFSVGAIGDTLFTSASILGKSFALNSLHFLLSQTLPVPLSIFDTLVRLYTVSRSL